MKRFHVHVAVADLDGSKAFYTKLFGADPAVVRHDYAKWLIDDPRVNFAISTRAGGQGGVEHLGLQAEDARELAEIRGRFAAAGVPVVDEPGANCCYARSDKHWAVDPQGLAWEAFHTTGEAEAYGDDRGPAQGRERACDPAGGCCAA